MFDAFKGMKLGDLLDKAGQSILKGFRALKPGWEEIGASPGEISFSVLVTKGVVWRLNAVLASGGTGRLLKAAFRHPETGEWLEAASKARSHTIRRIAKTMWYMACPAHGSGCVPADAPAETKVTTMKIRWTPSGRVLYSVDNSKFSIQQPQVALDKSDPVVHWFNRALVEIGEDMQMSSNEFTKWCNYQDMDSADFSDRYRPEKYAPAPEQPLEREVQAVNDLSLVIADSITPESFGTHAPSGDLDLPPMAADPLLAGLSNQGYDPGHELGENLVMPGLATKEVDDGM